MKYAIIGKRNRKVYEVTDGDVKEVFTVVDGDIWATEELHSPRCSSHKEVIEISDADAARIAANDHVPFARWYIVNGKLTDTKN